MLFPNLAQLKEHKRLLEHGQKRKKNAPKATKVKQLKLDEILRPQRVENTDNTDEEDEEENSDEENVACFICKNIKYKLIITCISAL